MAHCWSPRPIEVCSINRCAFSAKQPLQSFPRFPLLLVNPSTLGRLVLAPSCRSNVHVTRVTTGLDGPGHQTPIPDESAAAWRWPTPASIETNQLQYWRFGSVYGCFFQRIQSKVAPRPSVISGRRNAGSTKKGRGNSSVATFWMISRLIKHILSPCLR